MYITESCCDGLPKEAPRSRFSQPTYVPYRIMLGRALGFLSMRTQLPANARFYQSVQIILFTIDAKVWA